MIRAFFLALWLIAAGGASAQVIGPCLPSNAGGPGSELKTGFLDAGVTTGNGRAMKAEVLYYYCPDFNEVSGWRTVRFYCWADAVAACRVQMASVTVSNALTRAAAAPSLASQGLQWADALFKVKLEADNRPPPIRYVVAKAASTAKYPGKRPTVIYTHPSTVRADGKYIDQDTLCACGFGRYSPSATTMYCNIDPANQQRMAVCVRQ